MKNDTLGTRLASGNSNPYSNYDKKKELSQLKKQTFFKKNKNNFFKILTCLAWPMLFKILNLFP
jgi:hypothetical protein